MTPLEEHLRDSEFTDTWQAAEARQFLKDEAAAEVGGPESGPFTPYIKEREEDNSPF